MVTTHCLLLLVTGCCQSLVSALITRAPARPLPGAWSCLWVPGLASPQPIRGRVTQYMMGSPLSTSTLYTPAPAQADCLLSGLE